MPGFVLDLLTSALRVFHSGLESYEYGVQNVYNRDDSDHEVEGLETGLPDGDMYISGVESYVSNDSRALRRNRAFAEFEARTFYYNVAQRGQNSAEAHKVPADQLKRCLERQLGSDLLSTIENVVATGQQPHLDPNLGDLQETVNCLTTINKSIEDENEALLSDTAAINLSHANNTQHSDETRQSLIDLHEHLKMNGKSSGCSHDIMLQTTSFGRIKSIDDNKRLFFNLFLSPCPFKPQQWPQQWQEASCSVENDMRLLSYEEEDDGEDDFCTVIATYLDYKYALRVVFNHQSFRYQHEKQSLSFPDANACVTLRDLLNKHTFPAVDTDNSECYSLRDRYLLGLNLAQSLFYLFDGPWVSTNWKTEDIFFLATHGSTSMTVHSRHTPYIRCSLNIEDGEESQTQQRRKQIAKFSYPLWIALAQILLELHLGRSLAVQSDEPLCNAGQRQLLLQLSNSELQDSEFSSYKEAIETCLNFGFNLLSVRREARPKEERNLIRNGIIAKLEKNYKKCLPTVPEYADLDLKPNQQSQRAENITTSSLNKDTLTTTPISTLPARQGSPARPIPSQTAYLGPQLLAGVPILTLFDDNDSNDETQNESCRKFFEKIARFNEQYIEPLKGIKKSNHLSGKIKIAVLDSGVDVINDNMIRGALSRKRIRSGWSPNGTRESDFHDSYGHGTHVTRLVLKTAPLAEIHVAKISEQKILDETRIQDIVDAITWAVETVDAHIITMSFGMQKEAKRVTAAINSAVDKGKLVFAAAANDGGLQPRAFPARLPGVICIHATDGYGNPAIFNPTASVGCDNFSTVGVGVQSSWGSQTVYKSGTSFATPVAAGIVASILDFTQTHMRGELDSDNLRKLTSYRDMRLLLLSMAQVRYQYNFISPWNVFRELYKDSMAERQGAWNEVCEKLRFFIRTGSLQSHGGT